MQSAYKLEIIVSLNPLRDRGMSRGAPNALIIFHYAGNQKILGATIQGGRRRVCYRCIKQLAGFQVVINDEPLDKLNGMDVLTFWFYGLVQGTAQGLS